MNLYKFAIKQFLSFEPFELKMPQILSITGQDFVENFTIIDVWPALEIYDANS